MACGTVNVNVEEGWGEDCAGVMEALTVAWKFPRGAGSNGTNVAVFEFKDRVGEKLVAVPEPVGQHYGLHGGNHLESNGLSTGSEQYRVTDRDKESYGEVRAGERRIIQAPYTTQPQNVLG